MNNILDIMNNIRAGFSKIKSKAEDIMLAFMLWLAGVTHSGRVKKWVSEYTEKRIAQMRREIIKLNWRKSGLEKKI